MRREGAMHGWMKSYNEEQNRFRYSKRSTKGTNASKDSGRCRRSKCRGCHESPASKAMSKVKGQNKKHSQDVVANPELFDWSLAKGGKARKRNWEEDIAEVVPWRRAASRRAEDGFDEEECARAIAQSLALKEEAKGAGFEPEAEDEDRLEEEEEDGYSSAGCEPLPSDEDFHRALGESAPVVGEIAAAQLLSEEEGLSTDDEAFDSWEEQQQQKQQHESSSEADDDDDDGAESDGSGWSLCSLDEEEEEFVEIEEQDWAMV